MRIIYIVLICCSLSLGLFADEFEVQEDSYFGDYRTKMIWTLGTGVGSGSAHGYLNINNGLTADIELLRIMGHIEPESRFFKYIWCSIGGNYNLYEYNNNLYELAFGRVTGGVGINIQKSGIWEKMVPYIGGGIGYGIHSSKFNVNAAASTESGSWIFYLQVFGLEYRVTKNVAFFVEQNYIWGSLQSISGDNTTYIPDKYDDDYYDNGGDDGDNNGNSSSSSTSVPSHMSFVRNESDMRQLTVKLGVRFYWGLDMFWMYPFFWEN